MKCLLLMLGIAITSSLFAQKPSEYLIAVGAKREEVISHLGRPWMLYAPDLKMSYPSDHEDTLIEMGERFADVYRRPGPNELQITIWYGYDQTVSRLHPAERVERVDYVADRSEPYKVLLSRISEAVALCRSGCDLEGEVVGGMASIFACRAPKNGEEQHIMQSAANGWGHVGIEPWQWCAEIQFSGRYSGSAGYDHGSIDLQWDSLPVDKITIGPGMLPTVREQYFEFGNAKQRLGTWTSPAAER
ncbi:MAG: hypothetical protein ACLP7O_10345 [Terracidiphilus sp.]